MVIDVEIRILDPGGQTQTVRYQAHLQFGGMVDPFLDKALEIDIEIAFIAFRNLQYLHGSHIHGGLGGVRIHKQRIGCSESGHFLILLVLLSFFSYAAYAQGQLLSTKLTLIARVYSPN
jgi:hypothetical protein